MSVNQSLLTVSPTVFLQTFLLLYLPTVENTCLDNFYLLHCLRILNTFQKCKLEFSFLLNLLEVLKLHKHDQYFFLHLFLTYLYLRKNTPEWGQLHGAAALFILQKSKKNCNFFFVDFRSLKLILKRMIWPWRDP